MFSKSVLLAPLVAASLARGSPVAPRDTATTRAQTALTVLQDWYDESTGVWDTMGWWNGANAMTMIADLALVDDSVRSLAEQVFNNTYYVAPAVNPDPGVEKVMVNGLPVVMYPPEWPVRTHKEATSNTVNASLWLDGYYDDDSWWGLAWIAAYDVTGVEDYLELAEGIFEDLTEGWPTNCFDGGIWWDTTHTYANAIPNELFLSMAGHLANRVPSKADYYIDWAQREWNWFLGSGMINENNTINDGLTTTCENNGETVWTYNQGVVLGGLVELNKAAPNATYLEWATKIALAAIEVLTTDENVLVEPGCDPDCEPNGTQFKGIFIRNLQLLQSVAPNDKFLAVIKASAESLWENDRDDDNQLSELWQGPWVSNVNASTHSSAMDALVAHIVYN